MHHASVSRLALVIGSSALIACAAPVEEAAVGRDSALAVDATPLPTTGATLMAGDPYSPVLDERPLAIAGTKPCLLDPKIETTPGRTSVEASIVSSRRDLMNRLDLGVEGLPINVLKLTGATGSARLAFETDLREGALTLLFQARGTFESSLVGLGAELPAFDPARVGACGWGYVKKAYHRISAIVMVTIKSTESTNRVLLGCGKGEAGCTGTTVSAGPVSAKASIERTLQQGNFDISIRTLSDAVPELPSTPFGEMVALSSTPETAGDVMEKLGRALDWLGTAETAIAKRILAIEDGAPARAPTAKVDFEYYPGISATDRERLGGAYDDVIALRNDYETTLARASGWEAFRAARDEGHGYLFNVPTAPQSTEEDLEARASEAIGAQGFLTTRRHDLESALERCEDASKGGSVRDVVSSCAKLPPASWDGGYATKYGVARLAPMSTAIRPYDEWFDNMCPSGQRMPNPSEAALLAPFSHATGKEGKGIWLRRGAIWEKALYVQNGKVESVGLFQSPSFVTLCFAEGASLFE